MNKIYHVFWEQSGDFNLSAVVIAESGEEAIQALDLDNTDTGIGFVEINPDLCNAPYVICRESL